jgi:hypothetical protein
MRFLSKVWLTTFVAIFVMSCARQQPSLSQIPTVQAVSADQLRSEHKKDRQSFAEHYLTKKLSVTGKVHGITGQTNYPKGTWEIVLTSKDPDPNDFPWIACRVPDERVSDFATIWLGDQVTIEGTCDKCTRSGIILKDCKLKASKPH